MRVLSIKSIAMIAMCLIMGMIQAKDENPESSNISITDQIVAEKVEIVNLTNRERKKKGLGPLTINNLLMDVAQEQSDSMARKHHLSHTVNGKDFSFRIKNSGYPFRRVGENVARSWQSPPHVIQMWMKSHGHRVNILNPHFKEIGIGITRVQNGDKYFTQVYGAQR